jgi:hypothetical protein
MFCLLFLLFIVWNIMFKSNAAAPAVAAVVSYYIIAEYYTCLG